jgi:hypothetical protein
MRLTGLDWTIGALESYGVHIVGNAVRIILMPDGSTHDCRAELLALAAYLASLRLCEPETMPMGFELAYEYLYRGPFGSNETGMTAHFMRLAEITYGLSVAVDSADVHQRLKEFLTELSRDIGSGTNVEATVNALGQSL